MVPNGWSIQKLEQIATVERGKFSARPRNDPKYFGGNIPFVQTGDIAAAKTYLQNYTQTLNEDGLKVSRLFPKNTILITIAANIGDTAITSFDVACPDSLVAIRTHKDTDCFWLKLYLETCKDELDGKATQNAQKNINLQVLKPLQVLTPPLPEQRKIAQILSTWDKAIATTEKLIDASQQQKKALMQQLLTGKKRLVNPDTGKVFEGDWEEVRVANFGKVVTGNTPPKGDDSNYGSDISWATAEDFKGKYVGNTKVKLTKSGVSKARLVPKGSVLVTCIASIGKNAIADEDLTTNQQINAVIVNSKHCNEFFYYQIEFNKHKLLAWAGTTAVPILNKSSFEKILLLAPLKHEQQKIASVLTAADKEIELLETKLAHLKNEKKALMQQLLTGKRRVKVEAMEMA